jgi:ribonuclease HI
MSSHTVEGAINVFTDGSSLSKPSRRGGVGLRIVVINARGDDESVDIPLLGFKGSTNNEMELYACIAGIREAQSHPDYANQRKIVVHTDSRYVRDNYPRARFQWSVRGWRNAHGRPILNARLWKDLLKAVRDAGKKVEFNWIKGHAADSHNRAVDRLARQSARTAVLPPISRVNVRKKTTSKSLDIGSVKPCGQRISIRIITDQYLELPRCFKYKYEVLTRSSPYHGNVDIAFSSIALGAGHHYYVQMNADATNPTIVRVFRELPR